jgi:hypothetical protein
MKSVCDTGRVWSPSLQCHRYPGDYLQPNSHPCDPVGAYADLGSDKSRHRLDIVLPGNPMKLVG